MSTVTYVLCVWYLTAHPRAIFGPDDRCCIVTRMIANWAKIFVSSRTLRSAETYRMLFTALAATVGDGSASRTPQNPTPRHPRHQSRHIPLVFDGLEDMVVLPSDPPSIDWKCPGRP